MDQLRFTGLHADGTHLVVADGEGSEYAVPLDERLLGALRRRRADAERPPVPITPREVQSLIRSGQSAEEIADHTGWEQERVQRYEGPILAEREHVARLACAAHVRTHDRTGPPPTLQGRVEQRLGARGVDLDLMQWDATRPEGGQWSVLATFVAGQRSRQASWRFDPAARSLDALDDEARWLSEDEQSLPRDVSAETVFGGQDTSDDLMTSMRERSRKRGRGRRARPSRAAGSEDPTVQESVTARIDTGDSDPGSHDPGSVPGTVAAPGAVLPLEDFPYDPETMGLPPSAHGHGAAEGASEPEDEGSREATLEDFFGDFDADHEDEPAPVEQDEAPPGEQDESPPGEQQDPPHDVEQGEGSPEPQESTADPATARRRSRPSVPSWDDIMFGARGR